MQERELLKMYFVEGKKHYAFNLIVRKYSEKLYWPIRHIVLNHADADDVLQETFIKIWQSLPKFKAHSQLMTWMYRIAINEALQFQRKRKREIRGEEDDLKALKHLTNDPYFDGDQEYQRLLLAIDALPERQRIVFNLKYFDELKYSEIAAIIGGSEGSLKASYHHATKKIAEQLTSA
jgi:RNA polymerase sigma-70 factor (ECF subfamily)